MRGEIQGVKGLANEEGLTSEKQQEQLLMSKLAASGKLPARPQSTFLQKKLQQRKFFDSGDYAMDKDRAKHLTDRPHPLAGGAAMTEESPTSPGPQVIATSPKPPQSPEPMEGNDDGLQIPRPDTVPQRKASIINPGVQCKLSPQPHVHHEALPEC